MTDQDPYGPDQFAYDMQLAAWLDVQKHDILGLLYELRRGVETLSQAPEDWWTENQHNVVAVAERALAVTAHLTEIGRTDLPAYLAYDQIVNELDARMKDIEEYSYREQVERDHMFWARTTQVFIHWAKLLEPF